MYDDTIEVEVTRRWMCFRWTRKVRVPAPRPSTAWMTGDEQAYHLGGGFARG